MSDPSKHPVVIATLEYMRGLEELVAAGELQEQAMLAYCAADLLATAQGLHEAGQDELAALLQSWAVRVAVERRGLALTLADPVPDDLEGLEATDDD